MQQSLLDGKLDGKIGLGWLRRWYRLVGSMPSVQDVRFACLLPVWCIQGLSGLLLGLKVENSCNAKEEYIHHNQDLLICLPSAAVSSNDLPESRLYINLIFSDDKSLVEIPPLLSMSIFSSSLPHFPDTAFRLELLCRL